MHSRICMFAVLVLSVLISPSSADVKDYLDFSVNIAEIKGHLNESVIHLRDGDRQGAINHSKHPEEEYWALIKDKIKEKDTELFQSLENELIELPKLAEKASTVELAARVEKIFKLLDNAEAMVVPQSVREGFIFKTRVIISLMDSAIAEYRAGISDTGEVKKLDEYHDSKGFVTIAEKIYQEIRDAIDEKETQEIDKFFSDLKYAMETKQKPSKIESIASGIVHEFQEIADIEEKEKNEPVDIIENIKALLQQVVKEYEEKEYDEAEELAIKAYLENYELIEGMVSEASPELNEEIEHSMREELRQRIKDRVPESNIKELVNSITEKLDTAKTLIGSSSIEETTQPEQPMVKKENMVVWYGAIVVLASIAIAEGIVILKLGRKRE